MQDIILFWNDAALEADRVSHSKGAGEQVGPVLSARALGIVHLAMYDAFAASQPEAGAPYVPGLSVPGAGATTSSAVAGAAHAALSALYPAQRGFFDRKLAQAGGVLNPGHDFGITVARLLLAGRAGDPGNSDVGYVPSFARGHPDNPTQPFLAPFYGARSKGFAITARHVLKDPPFDDAEYLTSLREVRGLGVARS